MSTNQEETDEEKQITGNLTDLLNNINVNEAEATIKIACAIISNNHMYSKCRGTVLESPAIQAAKDAGQPMNEITIETMVAQHVGYQASILCNGIFMGMARYRYIVNQISNEKEEEQSRIITPPDRKIIRPEGF